MTALSDFQTVRSEKYANIVSFIADPEPESEIPNILERIRTIEDWILAKELE